MKHTDKDFQTPPPVADYMAGMIPLGARTILEPTPGEGNLVRAVEKLRPGCEITTPSNFFLYQYNMLPTKIKHGQDRYDAIIMNPPFSKDTLNLKWAPKNIDLTGSKACNYILKECMTMSDNVIALLPWYTIINSDVRMRELKAFGLKSITALPRKTFKYIRIQTAVFEFERGHKQETIFKTFDF